MKQSQQQESELLARAQAGDKVAYGELYERYLDAIYHYVYYRVNNAEDAEDLTETIFLQAWQALEDHPPREAPFRAWLYRIAHNAVVDFYRTRKEQVTIEAIAELADGKEGPETLVADQEQADVVKEAMAELKSEHQQVLTLRFIAGLSHAETASILARSEGAARALQYRALEALSKRLILRREPHV